MAPRRNLQAKSTAKSKPSTQSAASRLQARKDERENAGKLPHTTSPLSRRSATPFSPSKKQAGKIEANGKGSIQSFFNAATQRLQTSQESPNRLSRAATPLEPSETIDSDEEGSVISFSKGSSTELALRKRKAYNSNASFHDDASTASQKFRRTESGRVASMTLHNDDKRPWTVQFAPTTLVELAVHKRKVTDVRGWLDNAFAAKRNRALIIKGPAGAGKTTTLQLLARDMGIEVLEWSNPAGKEYTDSAQASSTQFEDFITRSGASAGLSIVLEDQQAPQASAGQVSSSKNQLLLVEEFPNTFSKTSPALQSFRSAIAQHLVPSRNKTIPLVMIISETLLSTNTAAADSFTTHRLLGPELSAHPYVDTIEFNAVAPTIILKALNDIVIKEARKSGRRTTPAPAILKRLTEFGDLRSAVSTLEFLCLRGDDDGNWSSKITFGKTKKKAVDPPLTKVEKEALEWISSRESSLGIFHAVGKVIYNKRRESEGNVPHPPSWLAQYRRPTIPENNVNSLIDDIGTDANTFVAALHENYPLSCNGLAAEQALDAAFGCVESLSDSDLLSIDRFSLGGRGTGSATEALRQDEMSFQLAVRGLLFSLPSNAKRVAPSGMARIDAHRMYYPASLRIWRQKEEIEAAIDSLRLRLRSQLRAYHRARLDTVYSMANTTATPWSRDEHGNDEEQADGLSSLILAHKAILVASLPYLAAILHSLNDRSMMDLLRLVTRITGRGVDDTNDGDLDNDDNDIGPGDQWSTDRADEGSKKHARPRLSRKIEHTNATTENSLANLVLEDDDIVDD